MGSMGGNGTRSHQEFSVAGHASEAPQCSTNNQILINSCCNKRFSWSGRDPEGQDAAASVNIPSLDANGRGFRDESHSQLSVSMPLAQLGAHRGAGGTGNTQRGFNEAELPSPNFSELASGKWLEKWLFLRLEREPAGIPLGTHGHPSRVTP